jgi:hypothetical protein
MLPLFGDVQPADYNDAESALKMDQMSPTAVWRGTLPNPAHRGSLVLFPQAPIPVQSVFESMDVVEGCSRLVTAGHQEVLGQVR